jgi:hypothetical protein
MALGQVASAASQPAGPSSAWQNAAFDSSGWTVNVGSGSATATATKIPTPSQAVGVAGAGVAGLLSSPLVLIAIFAIFAMKHK